MLVLRKKMYLNLFLADVLFLCSILPLVENGNIGQKLDNQYPKKCKYEVVLKFSKILNQL